MDAPTLLTQTLALADRMQPRGRVIETGLAGLRIMRAPHPTEIEHNVMDPLYCLVLQGEKHVRNGGAAPGAFQVVGPGQSYFVPLDLPLSSRIEAASPARPYVALALRLDMALLAELSAEAGPAESARSIDDGLRPVTGEPQMLAALARLIALAGQGAAARQVLEPLIRREMHYWLIASPHGAMLRHLSRPGGAAARIAQSVRTIRRDFAVPLRMADLARAAGMSASGFHAHFRSVTGTTPLQFQKSLRLVEARRLLVSGAQTVSSAAFAVGYESPTQFSREYARRFGHVPSGALRPADREAA